MWWLGKRSDFTRRKGEANRLAMKALVESGKIPGILAYDGRKPVGWCAVSPRSAYQALENSHILARVDEEPAWSVVCFFVDRDWRNRGMSVRLLKAAVEHVRRSGGRIVEGYPVEPKKGRSPDVFVFTGLASAFRKAGFREVMRRSPTRPIMRFYLPGSGRKNR